MSAMPFSMGLMKKGTSALRDLSNISFISNSGVSVLPELLVRGLIKNGDLVNVAPQLALPVQLFWHCWNLESAVLDSISDALTAKARKPADLMLAIPMAPGANRLCAKITVYITPPNAMNIEKDTAVTLRFKVVDLQGKLLEESKEPMVYLHGGYGNTLPKIEEALEGKIAGYQTTLELQPEDAFGLRDESLVKTIPKTQFPPSVKIGGQLEGRGDDGQTHAFTVTKIKGDTVLLDGNHPLAGKALRFSLTVADVRKASEEEIAHRHVHGEHGHHH